MSELDPSYGQSISGIESGGRYGILGPVIPKTGDRAYGKYQVMGANIPAWTEQYLGRRMTPDEFLADPNAQETVFQGEFGKYVQKYGPEGAARAWFAGEKNMNNMGAKDPLGTTVAGYGQKFMAGLGPSSAQAGIGTPTPIAAPSNAPPPSMPQMGLIPSQPQQQQSNSEGILSGLMQEQADQELQGLLAPPKPIQHLNIPMTPPRRGSAFRRA